MSIDESQEKIDTIKKKVSRTSLHVGRIPEKTKTEFIKLANSEFEEDYGMTIKWLMDFRKGLLESPNSVLSDRIDVLAEEIRQIKEAMVEKKPDEQKRKMLSGRVLKRRNENEQIRSPTGQKPSV